VQTEGFCRLSALALALAVFGVGLYHRLRSFRGERLNRRDEGVFILIGLRLCGVLTQLGLLVYLISPSAMGWSKMGMPAGLRQASLPVGLAALAWLFWMFRSLGGNLTDTVNVRNEATLVTTGPYRWVRHPMYVGVAGLLLAFTLLSDSALLVLLGGLVLVFLGLRTPTEEAKLEARFGEPYRRYRARTGAVLPRLGRPAGREAVSP
jgi:protein-S-isoprenylcysteine O-methyltransferase Ste14